MKKTIKDSIVALVLIVSVIVVALLSACNKSTTSIPIEEVTTQSTYDTVYLDSTQTYEKVEFPDTTKWNRHGEIVTVVKDEDAAQHPCCLNPWECTVSPGIPSMAPFYCSNNTIETVYEVIAADKPNETFTGVELAVLDNNNIWQMGSCDTTVFVGGMVSHSASCNITPPFTCS